VNNSMNNSTHRVTVRGEISDRKDPHNPRREVKIKKTESCKLSRKDYPITLKEIPEGLAVEIIDVRNRSSCQASLHSSSEGAYIGSATRRLSNPSQAALFSRFLQQAGVFRPGTPVDLDFEKCGNVIRVHLH